MRGMLLFLNQDYWKAMGEMGLLGITAPGITMKQKCYLFVFYSYIFLLEPCSAV